MSGRPLVSRWSIWRGRPFIFTAKILSFFKVAGSIPHFYNLFSLLFTPYENRGGFRTKSYRGGVKIIAISGGISGRKVTL